jgi:hypothetical protein
MLNKSSESTFKATKGPLIFHAIQQSKNKVAIIKQLAKLGGFFTPMF